MKRRVSRGIAGACVAGLVLGAPGAMMPASASAQEASSGMSAQAEEPVEVDWRASGNMNADIYGPPSMFEKPSAASEEPVEVLYGPPSMFEGSDASSEPDAESGKADNSDVAENGNSQAAETPEASRESQSASNAADKATQTSENPTTTVESRTITITMPQLLYGPPPVFATEDNPMKVRAVAKSVKATRVAQKKRTFKKAIVVKKAAGVVSFKKVAKKSSDALRINKETGAVTVRKGTKPGLYTARVKVRASGDFDYRPATKTVTVRVRVK